jgi:DNA-binding transcriptional LysR family regulator
VEEFGRDYPGITYEVRVAGSAKALAALTREECDIAITFEPEPHPDVAEVQAFRDPIVAIMHPTHPLASRTKLKLRNLANQRVALLDDSHVTRLRMDKALASEGVSLQSVLTTNQVSLAVSFARTGLAMTFAPRHIVRDDVKAGVLKMALIDYPSLVSTRFVLCRHKSRIPTLPAQAFLIALQRQFTAIDTEVNRPRARRSVAI